jgi:hypothetical protein
MRYGSCYLSERRYVKHVPVTGARAARSPGHVPLNVGQKTSDARWCMSPIQIARSGAVLGPEPHRTTPSGGSRSCRATGDMS